MEKNHFKNSRKRKVLKYLLTVLIVILIIFLAFYVRKLIIMNSLTSKYSELSNNCNNFYRRVTRSISDDNFTMFETWYKDGKYKQQLTQYTTKDGYQVLETTYGEINSKMQTQISNLRQDKTEIEAPTNVTIDTLLAYPTIITSSENSLLEKLILPFVVKISQSNLHYGKDYYIVNSGNSDILIDKDSGLLLKTISYNSLVLNYPGTDVQRGIYDDVSNFEFKLDVVNDSDVTNPN